MPPAPATAIAIDRRAEQLVLRGRWDEARQLVDSGLTDARARGDRAGEARLLLRRGHARTDETRHRGGDPAPALADLEAAHALAAAVGDAALVASSVDAIGMRDFVRWFSSQDAAELAAADQRFRQALETRAPGGASPALAESNFHVGLVHQMRGELVPALAAFERALAIATRVDDPLQRSHATRHLGYLAHLRHDEVAAEALYRESLALRAQVGLGPGVAAAQVTLAESGYHRDGDAARALERLTRARDVARATGSAAYVAISSASIARVHRDAGRAAEALRELAVAVAASDAIHSDEGVPEAYEQMALIHLLADDARAALRDAERGLARRSWPRFAAVRELARARAGQGAPSAIASEDPVVIARHALAAGDPAAALAAAIRGDDPDTLLLAARAVGPAACGPALAAGAVMSRAQARRFERALGCPAR